MQLNNAVIIAVYIKELSVMLHSKTVSSFTIQTDINISCLINALQDIKAASFLMSENQAHHVIVVAVEVVEEEEKEKRERERTWMVKYIFP